MAEQTQIINETNELKTHEAEEKEEKTRSARMWRREKLQVHTHYTYTHR